MNQKLHDFLTENKQTVATAESCTAGLVAFLLTELPGSSAYFKQGWVTYSVPSKIRELKIPASVINDSGVYSTETASWMARQVRILAETDWGVGVTGLTGESDVEGVPDRFVAFAIASSEQCLAYGAVYTGTREEIRKQVAKDVIRTLTGEATGLIIDAD